MSKYSKLLEDVETAYGDAELVREGIRTRGRVTMQCLDEAEIAAISRHLTEDELNHVTFTLWCGRD